MKTLKYAFAASALIALTLSNTAFAGSKVIPGSACTVKQTATSVPAYEIVTYLGYLYNKTSAQLYVICSFENEFTASQSVSATASAYTSGSSTFYCRVRHQSGHSATSNGSVGSTGWASQGGSGTKYFTTSSQSVTTSSKIWAECVLPRGDNQTSYINKITLNW